MPSYTEEDHLRLNDVTMAFGERPVFTDLSCSFPKGQISVILGGSGSGKSTILRLVGGLIHPVSGDIVVDGQEISRLHESDLRQVRDKIGMLFQGGALLDSLTVFDNLALPLREHSELSEAEIADEVHDRLDSVGLVKTDSLLPNQLSGGMRKRVALARALIRKPVILLCDEPFSGLDPISTRQIEDLLVKTNRARNITIVMVSHHVDSTMRMAGNIMILLPEGIARGTREELQNHQDPRVKAFLTADRDDPADADGTVEVLPGARL